VNHDLLAVLREEVDESCDLMARHLGALSSGVGDASEHVAALFRHAHNLKGAARMAGQPTIVAVAHAMEDVLGEARRAGLAPHAPLVSLLLEGVSLIERVAAADGTVDARLPGWAVALAEQRHDVGDAPPTASETGEPAVAEPALEVEVRAEEALATDASGGRQDQDLGTVPMLRLAADRVDGVVHRVLALGTTADALHRSLGGLKGRLDAMARLAHRMQGDVRSDFLAGMREVLQAWETADGERRDHRRATSDARDAAHRLRMVRLASEEARWRRVIRQAALDAGKDVRLVLSLGETEVDREVSGQLHEPLMHLLTNAVAHGLEDAETRSEAGKDPVGVVELQARTDGRWLHIDVSDDGRGVDLDGIAALAAERGAIRREDVERLSGEQRRELLFLPGFSTATRVTALSGRGVGLDAVRERARELGGDCVLRDSGDRPGAHFELRVPVAGLSRRVLVVEVGGSLVAIPSDDIDRVERVDRSLVRSSGAGSAAPLADGRIAQLIALAHVVGVNASPSDALLWISVMNAGYPRRGLVFDSVVGEQEIVMRPLPWNLRGLARVDGLGLLEDGRVAMLLDRRAWMSARQGPMVAASQRAEPVPSNRLAKPTTVTAGAQPAQVGARILVVDDSLTSRTLMRTILRGAGHRVVLAEDGAEGWDKLVTEGAFDLLVSDVEMPVMSGLELTRKVRSDPNLGSLPIILVTNLGGDDDRAAGALAGADEYIVKSSLDTRTLVAAVERQR